MKFILIFAVAMVSKFAYTHDDKPTSSEAGDQFFMKLFKRRRAEQLEAIKSLRKSLNPEKQHSMINLMAETVFSVIQDSRALIESSSYIPGISQFPAEEKVRDALSNILENTALFAELIIRFPNAASTILKTNNNWDVLLQWSIGFSNQVSYLLDKSTVKLLHLVSQELNHVEREPGYYNPYRDNVDEMQSNTDVARNTRKKVKKKIKKGPKLIYAHSEL